MTTPTLTTLDHEITSDSLKESILYHLKYSVGTERKNASNRDLYHATGYAVRQILIDRMQATEERHATKNAKRVYYLSMEFLIGKSLENNLVNMGILDACREALEDLGIPQNELFETEPDAGLGNGGLGRLAACFIDSMATLDIAGFGYGINYEYGLFKQDIQQGWQREKPDNWLTYGTPWQIGRPNEAIIVPLYGRVEHSRDLEGNFSPMWVDWQAIIGVPHDMPVVGYGAQTVNYLRLYSAKGSLDFDIEVFNEGDYVRAVEERIRGERISKVLYPSDARAEGRELRLIQEYFMVACCIRDMVRRHEHENGDIRFLPNHASVQMNDTHPALAVAELMRLLVDEKDLPWHEAWSITTQTLSYTNHTLLPEALEKWPVPLLGTVLPRHMEIIFEINQQFLNQVIHLWPGDLKRVQTMSLIEENDGAEKQVRMCNMAIVGSHSVNGVSALHSELVKTNLVPEFFELSPEKFNNKTNGITPRRWLLQANPSLAGLISDTIGTSWITDLDQLRDLEEHADDASFQSDFRRTKTECKKRLSRIIKQETNISVDPDSMFDVQVKRIHQYKRQLLAVLRIIREYFSIVEDGIEPACSRTYIFAGKAAPGYWAAKQIIGFINHVAKVVNDDPVASRWMKIVFLPNYRVSLAERIFPASELSEQISTAGYEASGTGNMKFMVNGALTIGTLDGANVEMLEEVGNENIFIFGRTAEEIKDWYLHGGEHGRDFYNRSPETRRIFDAVRGDRFSPHDSGEFGWIYDLLVQDHDPYFHLADLEDYTRAQIQASKLYAEPENWTRKAILNVARSGKFSSDRTIREYAREIWQAIP